MSHWDTSIGTSDEYYTPAYIFDALGVLFDLDVCCPEDGPLFVPCEQYIYSHSLLKKWEGFIWMNPPFGGRGEIEPWLDKFFEHGNGIALAPDRTSADWFWRAWKKAELAIFLKKVSFYQPGCVRKKQPSNGTVLFAIGEKGVSALRNAEKNGLGILARVG